MRRVRGWWILVVVGAGAWVTRVFSVCRAVCRSGVVVVPDGAKESEGVMVQGRRSAGWPARCAAVLMAALGAAGVAGCTTGGNPPPPTSPQPSTSVVVTTSPAPPTTSALSEDAAAIASTAKYIEGVNAAMKERSSARFVDTYWTGCVICEQDASRIDGLAKKGHVATGGELALASPRVESREGLDKVIVMATVSTAALTITDPTGKVIDKYAPSSGLKRFLVIKKEGFWKVGGILP